MESAVLFYKSCGFDEVGQTPDVDYPGFIVVNLEKVL
jgi:hypothetical protein